MPVREPFRMTAFQRGLYRHHINASRREDHRRKRPSGPLPLNLAAITRLLRVDEMLNEGEGMIIDRRPNPERQLLRIVAVIDDQGRKGVMAATVDRLYGTYGFRFRYKDDGVEYGGGESPLTDLMFSDNQPGYLILLRLCELLHADEVLGAEGVHFGMLARTLSCPGGAGFPAFTRGIGRILLDAYRMVGHGASPGVPSDVVKDGWYAQGILLDADEGARNLQMWVGRAEILEWQPDRPFWQDDAVKITFANGGYGPAVPRYQHVIGGMFLRQDDRFFRIDEVMAQMILKHVVRFPPGLSAILADCLKTL